MELSKWLSVPILSRAGSHGPHPELLEGEIPIKIVFYYITYTNMPVKLQIESVRSGVYR